MSEDNLKSTIESLLFASERPLTVEQVRGILDLDTDSIQRIFAELKSEYETLNRGMRIVEVAGGYQMITSPNFAPFLKKLFKVRHVERLSRPALETLAIIAYKQPITKHEIELLRNVNVDGVAKGLLEKSLIRIAGRKRAPGRPHLFGTTQVFLEYFGLKSLDDLPKMETFSPQVAEEELSRKIETRLEGKLEIKQ